MYTVNMQECRHSRHSDCTGTKWIVASTQTAHTATTPPTGDLQEQYTGVAMSPDLDYVRVSIMAHKAAIAPPEWNKPLKLVSSGLLNLTSVMPEKSGHVVVNDLK